MQKINIFLENSFSTLSILCVSLHYDATMGAEYRGQLADCSVLGTDLFSGAEIR
jgi:hypothetical protein